LKKNETKFRDYLSIDPSFFLYKNRLTEISLVLNRLKIKKSKIVLPSGLKPLFKTKGLEFTYDLNQLFKKWGYRKRKSERDFENVLQDPKYVNLLKKFKEEFSPIFADEIVGDVEKLGQQSILKNEVIDKLGRVKGNVVFELMAVCEEKTGIIISYNKKTISFIRKLLTPVLEGTSMVKHNIIQLDGFPKYLLFIGTYFSNEIVNNFINEFDIVGIPLPISIIGNSGFGIVADG